MNFEAIATAMMAESHCRMVVHEDLFAGLAAKSGHPNLLQNKEVTRELAKLAAMYERLGNRRFCQHVWEYFDPDGTRMKGLVRREPPPRISREPEVVRKERLGGQPLGPNAL